MNTRQDEKLNIISKLMDEKENTPSELKKIFELLFRKIEETLPAVLDEGAYIDNADIIRHLTRILKEKEILTVIPELAERSMVAVWGQSNSIEKIFQTVTKKKLGIEFNTNLPLLMIPMQKEMKNELYVITYMNKRIPVSFNEYKCITREIYKDNIDIRKLVKGFVLYYTGENLNQSYLILPEYIDTENEFCGILGKMVNKQLLLAGDNKKLQKIILKLFPQEIYLFGTNEDFDFVAKKTGRPVILSEKAKFAELCDKENVPCINYCIRAELQQTFLDIEIFYCKRKKVLKDKVARLTKDSIKLQEGAVKEQVQQYRKRTIRQQEQLDQCYQLFTRIYKEIMEIAMEFETHISHFLRQDLADNVNTDKYRSVLLRIFFKHVYAEDYDGAREDIVRLTRANYKYPIACNCLVKYKQGFEPAASDIVKLKSYPDSEGEIAKIKVELAEKLGLEIHDIKELMNHVSPIESGKEFYYLGKQLLDQNKYIQAAAAFSNSLDNDYEKAGAELIALAQKHPECKINIEKLAENLVAEANYYIGKKNIDIPKKYKKGVVNLKMAASQKHTAAIEMIADILFEKYKRVSWKNMEQVSNRNSVNNVIGLYGFLEQEHSDEKYRLRIGLMYCKLNEYARAYSLLKDIDIPDAQYECAKMHQYGNGVARDLQMAKKYYERITVDYRDAKDQYNKVCGILEREKERKARTGYSASRSYSSTSSYSSYSSSDWCFITTAACLALHESKDCDELNELRRFRDIYILGDGADGDELIEEYYRIGPEIVKCIDMEWNPFAIYTELWQDYISPSYKMIKENQREQAKEIYINMVKALCEKYKISVKASIVKRYHGIQY